MRRRYGKASRIAWFEGEVGNGVLRQGWSASVDDYPIAGGWTHRGEALAVGDVAGGVSVFEGKSGAAAWSHSNAHEGGVLAMALHPEQPQFATTGQDGKVRVWSAADDAVRFTIDVSSAWVEHVEWSRDGQWLAVSYGRQVCVMGEMVRKRGDQLNIPAL